MAWLLPAAECINDTCALDFQKLKHTESDKLQVQIQAYLDNVFDVGALLEDAETKNAALERVEELEENISHVSTKLKLTLPFNVIKNLLSQLPY